MPAGKNPTEAPPTGTDWQRVMRGAAAGAPASYDSATDADVLNAFKATGLGWQTRPQTGPKTATFEAVRGGRPARIVGAHHTLPKSLVTFAEIRVNAP